MGLDAKVCVVGNKFHFIFGFRTRQISKKNQNDFLESSRFKVSKIFLDFSTSPKVCVSVYITDFLTVITYFTTYIFDIRFFIAWNAKKVRQSLYLQLIIHNDENLWLYLVISYFTQCSLTSLGGYTQCSLALLDAIWLFSVCSCYTRCLGVLLLYSVSGCALAILGVLVCSCYTRCLGVFLL